ncbi:MAG: DUF2299 family protein [Nitrosotalea sp.]
MLDTASLQNKIKEWLTTDVLSFSEIKNDYADFQFALSNAFGLGFVIDIAKPKNKSILAFAMQLLNPPQIQQGFSSLNAIEKMKLLEGLKRELLKIGVEYNIADDMKVVTIINHLYVEDITHTLFMESLKLVRNASLIVMSTLSEKFTLGISSMPPHSHSELNSPYG